jgi:hypothetical protein
MMRLRHTRLVLIRRFGMHALLCQLAVIAALCATTHGIAATGHPAGGINAEPSIRPTVYLGANPDSWWCQPPNCHQSADPKTTIDRELSLAARLHVANVRIEFPWALMQLQQNAFDWSRADLIVFEARSHHVTLQPVLMWTPAWESSDISQVTSADDFASFVKTFVTRYDHAFPVIEMWNEPDGGSYGAYTNGREQVYVATILNPGYAAVKAVDHSIAVELGGSINDSGSCCPFLQAVIADGGTFDIAAFHNYIGASSAVAEAQAYRALLDRSGRTAAPIWMGEYGVQEATAADGQQQLLMHTILGGSSDLAVAQWYNIRDDFAMSFCPPNAALAAHWGLVLHDDCTVKEGYAAMAHLLGGDPSDPSCSSAANGTSRSSSAGRPGGPATGPATGSQRAAANVLPWAVAAVAAAVAIALLLFRYRDRFIRRAHPEKPPDDDG